MNLFKKLTFEWIMSFAVIGIAASVMIILWLIQIGMTKLIGR